MNLKLSQYHVVTQAFFDQIEESVKRIIYSTRSGDIRVIDEGSWQIVTTGKFEQLPSDILSELAEIKLLVPREENELETIIKENNQVINENDSLYEVIQPTAYCQLGCHYCGQEHTPKLLSEENQERLLKRIRTKLETKKFKTLSIGWFGAEPLVGLSVIRKITPQLQALAKEFNCSYRAKIVTNGLALTDKTATEIVNELGVQSIEITLDGTAAFHNARRHQKSGLPTFEKIFSNVVSLAKRDDLDVYLSIRCNVDRQNYQSVSELLRILAEKGLQERISFYVAPIHSWGNDAHLGSLSAQEFANWEIKWYSEMIQLGFQPGLLPQRRPIVCMAVRPQAELVDASGNIFNCSEVS